MEFEKFLDLWQIKFLKDLPKEKIRVSERLSNWKYRHAIIKHIGEL